MPYNCEVASYILSLYLYFQTIFPFATTEIFNTYNDKTTKVARTVTGAAITICIMI